MADDIAEALPGVRNVDNRITITGDRPTENSDTWVSMKVKSALLFHRSVSATKTEVFVTDGVVTLKGEAQNQAQKDLTTEYAKDVDDVKSVDNQMTVATIDTKPDETAGATIDDASITAQVKSSLLSHRSTGVLRTKVETTEGVVTLGGIARNDAEKALVTKLATDINGVKSVVNNMTVATTVSSNN
jgi:osmotically-inducible protein OsmY